MTQIFDDFDSYGTGTDYTSNAMSSLWSLWGWLETVPSRIDIEPSWDPWQSAAMLELDFYVSGRDIGAITLDQVDDEDDVEILTLGAMSRANSELALMMNVQGNWDDSTFGYYILELRAQDGLLRLAIGGDPAGDKYEALDSTTPPFTVMEGVWYWIRWRRDSAGNFSARAWEWGTSEPVTWQVSATDTTWTGGRHGIAQRDLPDTYYYEQIGFGTGGDEAPAEAPAVVDNVNVLLPGAAGAQAEAAPVKFPPVDPPRWNELVDHHSPVAHWSFDGDATDRVGSYDLTTNGTPVETGAIAPHAEGSAYLLNGTTDGFERPSTAALQTSARTVVTVFRQDAGNNGGFLFNDRDEGNSNGMWLWVPTYTNRVEARTGTELDGWDSLQASKSSDLGQVMFVAHSVEGTEQKIWSGRAGEALDVVSQTMPSAYAPSNFTIEVGQENFEADLFEGPIGDTIVFDRVLTDAEVESLFAGFSDNFPTNLSLDAVPADVAADAPTPTVTTQVSATVGAVSSDAVADAPAPSVLVGQSVQVAAAPADASADAPAPSLYTQASIQVQAAVAEASADMPNPVAGNAGAVAAPTAGAVADLPAPGVSVHASVGATPADATGAILAPSVDATSNVTIYSDTAVATADSPAPTITVQFNALVDMVVADATADFPRPSGVGELRDYDFTFHDPHLAWLLDQPDTLWAVSPPRQPIKIGKPERTWT